MSASCADARLADVGVTAAAVFITLAECLKAETVAKPTTNTCHCQTLETGRAFNACRKTDVGRWAMLSSLRGCLQEL